MDIQISELDTSNLGHVNQWDDTFMADSKLFVQIENNVLDYVIEPMPSYRKQYPRGENYSAYIANADQILFIAYVAEQPFGQIALRKNWNRCAFIEELSVDARFRQRGVGRALMDQGVVWAKGKNLAGVMAETQDINVGACLFYERYGFRLGGFDRMLYHGIASAKNEIALLWYLMFT